MRTIEDLIFFTSSSFLFRDHTHNIELLIKESGLSHFILMHLRCHLKTHLNSGCNFVIKSIAGCPLGGADIELINQVYVVKYVARV